MGLKDTHRQGLEASDRKLLTAEGNRDTSGLKNTELGCDTEHAGCPSTTEPCAPLREDLGKHPPRAYSTHTGQGSLREEGPSTYFRITRLAAWMACSNLGERRVPCNPAPLIAHRPPPALGF